MALPKFVKIHDDTPREGWQNLKKIIPTEKKIELIKDIIDSGQTEISVTLLPNPKYVPQHADSEDVVAGVIDYAEEHGVLLGVGRLKESRYQTMIERGLIREGVTVNSKRLTTLLAISDEHAHTNFHSSVEEQYARAQAVADKAKAEGKEFGGAIICAFGSPVGDVSLDDLIRAVKFYRDNGATFISLADTDGLSNPANTERCLDAVLDLVPAEILDCHLHDTAGFGLTNTYIALHHGIASFDSCIGGLGGCPFIPDARGMIATEDIINLVQGMGIECNLDLDKTMKVARKMGEELGIPMVGYMDKLYMSQLWCQR